jgi:hypothetical protein
MFDQIPDDYLLERRHDAQSGNIEREVWQYITYNTSRVLLVYELLKDILIPGALNEGMHSRRTTIHSCAVT